MNTQFLLRTAPELQRNLWLEFNPARLLIMPLVIGLIVWAVYGVNGQAGLNSTLNGIVWILVVFWGTRLAAESFHEEVQNRTWDTQRLTAASATGLVLSKLLGGTAYAWYGAFICFGIELVMIPQQAGDIPYTILNGLLGQAMALFIVVAFRPDRQDKRGSRVFLAQLNGIVVASSLMSEKLTFLLRPANFGLGMRNGQLSAPQVTWYGSSFDAAAFMHCLSALAVLWLIIGTVRVMRRDLGYRDGPLAWLGFSIFMVALVAGAEPPTGKFFTVDSLLQWLILPMLITVVLLYTALLAQTVSPLKTRKLANRLFQYDWRKLWAEIPGWFVSLLMFLGILAALSTSARGAQMTLAFLGFMLRDIVIVYGCRLRYPRRSGGVITLLAFLLYGLGSFVSEPMKNMAQQDSTLVSIFLPFTRTWAGVAYPWIEALVVFALFLPVFRRAFRPEYQNAP